jgi:hypothetical protein
MDISIYVKATNNKYYKTNTIEDTNKLWIITLDNINQLHWDTRNILEPILERLRKQGIEAQPKPHAKTRRNGNKRSINVIITKPIPEEFLQGQPHNKPTTECTIIGE